VLNRGIEAVYILPLHGVPQQLTTVEEAITFLENYNEAQGTSFFVRYEVSVRYTNGDEIHGKFHERYDAIAFLRTAIA
jgi:hypothetical protein